MSLIPADLTREDGDILAAMYRDPCGYVPSSAKPYQLANLARLGFIDGLGKGWVATAAGNAAGLEVIQDWYGEVR